MAAQTPLVYVVIPNWNGKHFLSDSLEALREQSYPNIEIILVDNGSTDGSVEYVRAEFPEVHLITHTKNLGFAEGTNAGIRAAKGRWIATLNNDTWAEPEWVAESLKAITWGKKIGVVASRIVFMSNPHLMNSAGIWFDYTGRA
jgi:GT2 family glycosyltransferase